MITQANTEHINGIVSFCLKHLPGPNKPKKLKSEALKSDVTVIRGPVSWSRGKPAEKAESDLSFFCQVFKLNKLTNFCYLLVERLRGALKFPLFLSSSF